MNARIALAIVFVSTLVIAHLTSYAQGMTAFTYQGQLKAGGTNANGTYNLTFTLFNVGSGSTPVAGPVTNNGVSVVNGLFTVTMDFGSGVWDGATNWLEIGVEANGAAGFTTLTPRQLLTPAPQSIYSQSAGTANNVSVTATLQGQSLNIGSSNNVSGANATVAGGSFNNVSASYSVIAGGSGNTVASNYSFVGGGSANLAGGNHSTVTGGEGNIASGDHSTLAGGEGNVASGDHGVVGGGEGNSTIDFDVVAGGQSNIVD